MQNNTDNGKDTKSDVECIFSPSIEMAESRIEQALIRYALTVEDDEPTRAKEKIRL